MEFVNIDDCFKEEGLKLPNLTLLIPDERTYEMLLMQPEGTLSANSSSFYPDNNSGIEEKAYSFLKLAYNKKVELAVTPEYSCPWNTIEKILEEGIFPETHNIWVVGCESISVQELKAIVGRNKQYRWIFDKNILNGRGNFLNPVCYLFNTYNIDGEPECIILIQFKTKAAGDGGIGIERDNLILGKTVYYIRNNEDSIHLATLICSDSIGFIYNLLKRLLLIHIELNPKPSYDTFKEYRNQCFTADASRDQAILCLNWARKTEVYADGTEGKLEIIEPNSAYYVKDDIDPDDNRISGNHELGLYYTCWQKKHAHTWFFNYDEHVFHLRCTKPWQGGAPAAVARKTGPEMLCCYSWYTNNDSWGRSKKIDEGIVISCKVCSKPECPLKCKDLTPINKERLVLFSNGTVGRKDWPSPSKLASVQIDDSETARRFTFAQNKDKEYDNFRKNHLEYFCTLNNDILKKKCNFPSFLKYLYGSCYLWFNTKHKSYNLYQKDPHGNNPSAIAGVVYVGDSKNNMAKLKYDKITSFLDECDRKVFMLWYREYGETKRLDYGLPEIDVIKEDPRAITEA